ncbi:unnamed protein product, partial [Trichogramma brassicae]
MRINRALRSCFFAVVRLQWLALCYSEGELHSRTLACLGRLYAVFDHVRGLRVRGYTWETYWRHACKGKLYEEFYLPPLQNFHKLRPTLICQPDKHAKCPLRDKSRPELRRIDCFQSEPLHENKLFFNKYPANIVLQQVEKVTLYIANSKSRERIPELTPGRQPRPSARPTRDRRPSSSSTAAAQPAQHSSSATAAQQQRNSRLAATTSTSIKKSTADVAYEKVIVSKKIRKKIVVIVNHRRCIGVYAGFDHSSKGLGLYYDMKKTLFHPSDSKVCVAIDKFQWHSCVSCN